MHFQWEYAFINVVVISLLSAQCFHFFFFLFLTPAMAQNTLSMNERSWELLLLMLMLYGNFFQWAPLELFIAFFFHLTLWSVQRIFLCTAGTLTYQATSFTLLLLLMEEEKEENWAVGKIEKHLQGNCTLCILKAIMKNYLIKGTREVAWGVFFLECSFNCSATFPPPPPPPSFIKIFLFPTNFFWNGSMRALCGH